MKGDEYSGYVLENKAGVLFSKSEKELIAENIKRILTTRKGERINEPDFGSRVKEFLFLPQMYVDDLMDEIKASIEKWEPRVTISSCTLETSRLQEDVVNIKLEMLIKTQTGAENTEVEVSI